MPAGGGSVFAIVRACGKSRMPCRPGPPSTDDAALPDRRDPLPPQSAQTAALSPGDRAASEYGQGRRKLLEAATRLAAREGHSRFSLRELAREAGLSHNSLYRHFQSVEEMMPELVAAFCEELRAGLSQARRQAPAGEAPSRTVTAWLLDFAQAHRDAFLVAMRQRFGPPGVARSAIELGLQQIRQDMLADLAELGHLPTPLPPRMDWAVQLVGDQSFALCIEYIEHPERRDDILARAELSFLWIMGGALGAGRQSR